MGTSERNDIDLIRGQVRTINESRYLQRAPQLRQMLSYVVERVLENRENELKEYSLGVEVFERPTDFDPRIDPIVRVQARNLRSRLERYYANEGTGDTAIIEVPAGSYIPRISLRSARNAAGNQKPTRTLPRIAVLPFENAGGEEEHEYLSDGISEELISALARLSGLRVLARTSSFSFRGKNATAREIGEALNADLLVEGTVRLAGSRIRVSARLIKVSDRNAVWSQSYDRAFDDLFSVEEEIGRAIASELRIELSREEARRLATPGTENMDSYQAYLRGWHSWNKWTEEGLKRGLRYFEEAIELDPLNAPAHAGLSLAYCMLANNGVARPLDIAEASRRAAERAVEIDPALGEAHLALGAQRALLDFHWDHSEAALSEAIRLSPSLATAHQGLAESVLVPMHRFDEAIEAIRTARALNPLSVLLRGELAFILITAGKFDESVDVVSATINVHPDHYFLYEFRAWANYATGRQIEALADMERAYELECSPEITAFFCKMAAECGQRQRAQKLRQTLAELGRSRYISSMFQFLISERESGKPDWDFLEKAYVEREPLIRFLTSCEPWFGRYWSQPRLLELARKMNLPLPPSQPTNS